MSAQGLALSHCPTLLGVGTMGQGTAETGGTAWDKWDKWDRGTLALAAQHGSPRCATQFVWVA